LSSPPSKTVPTEVAERARRADAIRNRQRILDAALAAFRESGFDAQMPEIARRADVGVGTLYRHFSTKGDLVGALADQNFERMVEMTREALDSGLPPLEAFETFIWRAARRIADDRGLAELMARKREILEHTEPPEELPQLGSELIGRAKESGDLREDATVADIPTILCGLGQVVATQGEGPQPFISWERYVELMLAGLKRQ
jgi:AcrR family transcriptional regulator